MKNIAKTIEDLLEILAGLQGQSKMQIEASDATIMYSIARQSFKGTALTDRQYALMKEKLQTYRDQFTALDYDFDRAVENLRLPLRQIDRSKYVKIVDHPSDIVYNSDNLSKFIKIRFPFRKTDIMLINEINHNPNADYYHVKGSHEHYFSFTEQNVFNVVSRFIDKNYSIDAELIDLYNEISNIKNNITDHVCSIVGDTIVNMNPTLKKLAISEVGKINKENKILYIDRQRRYGVNFIDAAKEPMSLTEKIAYRSNKTYHSRPSKENMSEVLSTLWKLQRFPLLVVLDKEHAENQLHEMITFYRDILSSEEQSVLFRQDGDSEFNLLIKDRRLNNWVDKNTKIVYISNDKLPKLLLQTDFQPFTTLSYTSSINHIVDTFINFNSDLVVYREEEMSPFRKHSRYYD